jgi:hypothetical protein
MKAFRSISKFAPVLGAYQSIFFDHRAVDPRKFRPSKRATPNTRRQQE